MAGRTFVTGSMALALLSCSALDDPPPADIQLSNGWTREIAPGQNATAVYLTIANRGDGGDRLNTVQATLGKAGLHTISSSDGIARMRPIENGLVIEARSTVELKPGGTHIMLTGLTRPLKQGETIELDLGFQRSGNQPVSIRVVSAGGDSHSGHSI